MADAVRKHKRILQTGSMERSNPLNRYVCELVREGRIGAPVYVTGSYLQDWLPHTAQAVVRSFFRVLKRREEDTGGREADGLRDLQREHEEDDRHERVHHDAGDARRDSGDAPELQRDLGELSRVPRWAIAFKFPAHQEHTIVEEIFASVGRTGALLRM